ncbi:hypothetical protein ACQ4LE_006583 [Meloidogyne hapla]
MYNLQVESKLDIFKCLNFKQLTSIRQTNYYFNALIGRYEGELACKKFHKIGITDCFKDFNYKFSNPQDGVFNFKITYQLMEKWKTVVDRQIPIYLNNIGRNQVVRFYKEPDYNSSFNLKFPIIPRNIEEIKIIRCWFEKISRCYFKKFDFFNSIFNPEFIQLIFEKEEINKIKFNCHSCQYLCIRDETVLMFYLNLLVINESVILRYDYYPGSTGLKQDSFDILFKFVLKIPKVFINDFMEATLCKLILNHIETSKENIISNQIQFEGLYDDSFTLSERAEFIEEYQGFHSSKYKYKLTNIHNPNVKFSIFLGERNGHINRVHIDRISEFYFGLQTFRNFYIYGINQTTETITLTSLNI